MPVAVAAIALAVGVGAAVASSGRATPEAAAPEPTDGQTHSGASPAPTQLPDTPFPTSTPSPSATPTASTSPTDVPHPVLDTPFYTVIVASRATKEEAQQAAERLASLGYSPLPVFWSGDYPSLNAGYWVAATGEFSTSAAADSYASPLRAIGYVGDDLAYARCVSSTGSC